MNKLSMLKANNEREREREGGWDEMHNLYVQCTQEIIREEWREKERVCLRK